MEKNPAEVHWYAGLFALEVAQSKTVPLPEQISGMAGVEIIEIEGAGLTVTVLLSESVQPVEVLVTVTV